MNKQQLIQENVELRAQIASLVWDTPYNCYTRAGIEHIIWKQICNSIEAIISFDIDDMHGMNKKHGQAVVDRKIRKSLKLRSSDFAFIARIKSGDECAIFVTRKPGRKPTDLEAMKKRLERSFEKNGLTITAAIYKTRGCEFDKNIKDAFRLVEIQKHINKEKLKGRD